MQHAIPTLPANRAELNRLLARARQERAASAYSFFSAIFRHKTVKKTENHDFADVACATA